MKISIENELKKASELQRIKIDPTSEVKLLLQGESAEDARILRNLSDDSNLNRIEKIRGKQIELENLEKSYEGKVFTIDQIKKLCINYRLRFLSSKKYTGSYDVEVAAKIKEFAKNTNSPIDDYSLGRRYFIMAPPEMFALREEIYISKRDQDPAIFFQIDDTHYRLIHKWGNDFSILRLLQGFRWKTFWTFQWFNTFMLLPFVTMITFLVIPNPAAFFDNHALFASVSSVVISFLIAFVAMGWSKLDPDGVVKGFFSEWNWNIDSKLKR